ncbi:nucleoside-diphosphate kinase [Candidatus Woesearchaeota archaeon]|nr:nucleoside-diphosphate kinase [Candidatus Woesearchaeota archaeon]
MDNWERTLVIVKPHAMQHAGLIINQQLTQVGCLKLERVVETVPRDLVARHYAVHDGKPFYPLLIEQFEGRRVHVAVYEGPDVIKNIRDRLGPTDPAKARQLARETGRSFVRAIYSDPEESMERAKRENRATNNVAHASDSKESADHEIGIWLPSYFQR